MQGREGQGNDAWEKSSGQRLNGAGKHPSLNGTSKYPSIASELQATGRQPAIPKRPPGMTRVSPPPSGPRIERPQRQPAQPGARKRRLLIFGAVLVVCALLACGLTYLVTNLTDALKTSNGAAATANDFLSALSKSNYTQAYSDLGPPITLQPNIQETFQQQAQRLDSCYGPVKSFSEVADSAVYQGSSQSYTYTIVRDKLAKPYQLRLTLQQDQDGNSWKITDYGSDLGPGQGAPACK